MIHRNEQSSEWNSRVNRNEAALLKMKQQTDASLSALEKTGVAPEQLAGGTLSTASIAGTDGSPAMCALMLTYDAAVDPVKIATICADNDPQKFRHVALALRARTLSASDLLLRKARRAKE